MLTFSSIAVLLLIAASIGRSLLSLRAGPAREDYLRVVRAVRWWMVPLAVVSLTTCLSVCLLLLAYGPAWLGWGWWSALGGKGNVNLGQTGNEGLLWSLTGWLIPAGLAAVVPLLARQEEVLFRYGTETSTGLQTLTRSLGFGLIHLIAGIPFAAALALTVPGLVFATVYRRAFDGPRLPALVTAPATDWGEYETISDPQNRMTWLAERLAELDAEITARQEISRRRDEWHADLGKARERATDVAAAMHTVSNWCAIGLLLAVLALT